jgi:hypothetical protein
MQLSLHQTDGGEVGPVPNMTDDEGVRSTTMIQIADRSSKVRREGRRLLEVQRTGEISFVWLLDSVAIDRKSMAHLCASFMIFASGLLLIRGVVGFMLGVLGIGVIAVWLFERWRKDGVEIIPARLALCIIVTCVALLAVGFVKLVE